MIQIHDLEAMLKTDKNAEIAVYLLKSKRTSDTGMPELISNIPVMKRVFVMLRVMFFGKGPKYGQRKKTLTSAKFCFVADFEGNQFSPNQAPARIDQNTLSDPALIEVLKNAGLELKPVSTSVQMSDEEMLAYLKEKGAVSGNVKLKGEEPATSNPLDAQ